LTDWGAHRDTGKRADQIAHMFNLILFAAPFFLALLALEWVTFRHTGDDDEGALLGYQAVDTATSLAMGLGNLVINLGWKIVVVAIYSGIYELTPLRVPSDAWWAWVLLFFADDAAYYWFHRVSHEVRVFWAAHVTHHSSQSYNLSTALRQTWVPMTSFPFWLPLALVGIKPWMIVLEQSVSLVYQFWIHTERVGRLPRVFELVLNTPSHHRAHHGSNQVYLDRNYAGILIVWDRLLGTFQAETERVRYGLTKNIETHNPARVAFHEYAAIVRDVRASRTWRERLGYVFGGPGWTPGAAPDPLVAEPALSVAGRAGE
jgi:sterol desaturase/sphingolipid hydroxylase (fatty acid hydroxylase superfamily)